MKVFYRILSFFMVIVFIMITLVPPGYAQMPAQSVVNLPIPGSFVGPTDAFMPTMVRGITIHPDNPLKFNFIIDSGDTAMPQGEALNTEITKLVKYFLAALTVPEKEMWVNLSPNEPDRIIAGGLGETDMGRDMLAQDYMLKQLTSSLMHPEEDLGEEFWTRVYERAQAEFGTTDIPMDTFHKVWIVPEKAVVYEHEATATTYVLESHLKVMLEEDYLAMEHADRRGLIHQTQDKGMINHTPTHSNITTSIIRDILLPAIEHEVNEGKTFANLRQIYHAMILAAWYKQNLKQSLLGQVYVDQNKIKGIDTEDKQMTQKIYDQYLDSFRKGVYDYIKEDYDAATDQIIPRKYFSGGIEISLAMLTTLDPTDIQINDVATIFISESAMSATVDLASLGEEAATSRHLDIFNLAGREQDSAMLNVEAIFRDINTHLKEKINRGNTDSIEFEANKVGRMSWQKYEQSAHPLRRKVLEGFLNVPGFWESIENHDLTIEIKEFLGDIFLRAYYVSTLPEAQPEDERRLLSALGALARMVAKYDLGHEVLNPVLINYLLHHSDKVPNLIAGIRILGMLAKTSLSERLREDDILWHRVDEFFDGVFGNKAVSSFVQKRQGEIRELPLGDSGSVNELGLGGDDDLSYEYVKREVRLNKVNLLNEEVFEFSLDPSLPLSREDLFNNIRVADNFSWFTGANYVDLNTIVELFPSNPLYVKEEIEREGVEASVNVRGILPIEKGELDKILVNNRRVLIVDQGGSVEWGVWDKEKLFEWLKPYVNRVGYVWDTYDEFQAPFVIIDLDSDVRNRLDKKNQDFQAESVQMISEELTEMGILAAFKAIKKIPPGKSWAKDHNEVEEWIKIIENALEKNKGLFSSNALAYQRLLERRGLSSKEKRNPPSRLTRTNILQDIKEEIEPNLDARVTEIAYEDLDFLTEEENDVIILKGGFIHFLPLELEGQRSEIKTLVNNESPRKKFYKPDNSDKYYLIVEGSEIIEQIVDDAMINDMQRNLTLDDVSEELKRIEQKNEKLSNKLAGMEVFRKWKIAGYTRGASISRKIEDIEELRYDEESTPELIEFMEKMEQEMDAVNQLFFPDVLESLMSDVYRQALGIINEHIDSNTVYEKLTDLFDQSKQQEINLSFMKIHNMVTSKVSLSEIHETILYYGILEISMPKEYVNVDIDKNSSLIPYKGKWLSSLIVPPLNKTIYFLKDMKNKKITWLFSQPDGSDSYDLKLPEKIIQKYQQRARKMIEHVLEQQEQRIHLLGNIADLGRNRVENEVLIRNKFNEAITGQSHDEFMIIDENTKRRILKNLDMPEAKIVLKVLQDYAMMGEARDAELSLEEKAGIQKILNVVDARINSRNHNEADVFLVNNLSEVKIERDDVDKFMDTKTHKDADIKVIRSKNDITYHITFEEIKKSEGQKPREITKIIINSEWPFEVKFGKIKNSLNNGNSQTTGNMKTVKEKKKTGLPVIAVMEKSEKNQEMIKNALSDKGYELIFITTQQQARDVIKDEDTKIDLVIAGEVFDEGVFDENVPAYYTSDVFLEWLNADDIGRNIPVFVLAHPYLKEAIMELHNNVKDVVSITSIDELTQKVQGVLGKSEENEGDVAMFMEIDEAVGKIIDSNFILSGITTPEEIVHEVQRLMGKDVLFDEGVGYYLSFGYVDHGRDQEKTASIFNAVTHLKKKLENRVNAYLKKIKTSDPDLFQDTANFIRRIQDDGTFGKSISEDHLQQKNIYHYGLDNSGKDFLRNIIINVLDKKKKSRLIESLKTAHLSERRIFLELTTIIEMTFKGQKMVVDEMERNLANYGNQLAQWDSEYFERFFPLYQVSSGSGWNSDLEKDEEYWKKERQSWQGFVSDMRTNGQRKVGQMSKLIEDIRGGELTTIIKKYDFYDSDQDSDLNFYEESIYDRIIRMLDVIVGEADFAMMGEVTDEQVGNEDRKFIVDAYQSVSNKDMNGKHTNEAENFLLRNLTHKDDWITGLYYGTVFYDIKSKKNIKVRIIQDQKNRNEYKLKFEEYNGRKERTIIISRKKQFAVRFAKDENIKQDTGDEKDRDRIMLKGIVRNLEDGDILGAIKKFQNRYPGKMIGILPSLKDFFSSLKLKSKAEKRSDENRQKALGLKFFMFIEGVREKYEGVFNYPNYVVLGEELEYLGEDFLWNIVDGVKLFINSSEGMEIEEYKDSSYFKKGFFRFKKGDIAMLSEGVDVFQGGDAQIDALGGINLDAAMLDLQVRRDGRGVPLPFDMQPADLSMRVKGFVPILRGVTFVPVVQLLGLGESDLPNEEAWLNAQHDILARDPNENLKSFKV